MLESHFEDRPHWDQDIVDPFRATGQTRDEFLYIQIGDCVYRHVFEKWQNVGIH